MVLKIMLRGQVASYVLNLTEEGGGGVVFGASFWS